MEGYNMKIDLDTYTIDGIDYIEIKCVGKYHFFIEKDKQDKTLILKKEDSEFEYLNKEELEEATELFVNSGK